MIEDGGVQRPLKAVCQISASDPRTLMVVVPEAKLMKAAMRGIQESSLGITPVQHDTTVIKVPVPKYARAPIDRLERVSRLRDDLIAPGCAE